MQLTLELGHRRIDIDLGEPSDDDGHGFFDDGDLAAYGGNLYLHLDGQEYGSLFFYVTGGRPRIELGQFQPETQQWEPANPLTSTVAELQAAHETEREAGR